MGTIPPARIRGPPCRLRLSFHTREAPKVRTFAGRYGKCDHLLFKAFFPPGGWSLTSLPEGGAEGTEAEGVARVGLLLPSRQAVPPPPKVEVKGRSPVCVASHFPLPLAWGVNFVNHAPGRGLFKPPEWAALAWGDEDEKPNNRTSAIQSPLAGRRLLKLPVGQRSLGAGCLFALVRGVGC